MLSAEGAFCPKHLARSWSTRSRSSNFQRGKGMQKFTRTLAMASAIAFMGVLAGCGDDVSVGDNLAVTVTPTAATVAVAGNVQLTASVTGNNSNKTVNWKTSDA